jgi:sec-independent protein translocase protein TatA
VKLSDEAIVHVLRREGLFLRAVMRLQRLERRQMRIGPFGVWEILVIVLVLVLLFGASRLPALAKGIGQAIREFRGAIKEEKKA